MFLFQLKWTEPDEEGLVKYMVEEKGFSEDRIRNGAKKLVKARNSSTQGRLDSFFKVLPQPSSGNNKRKVSKFVKRFWIRVAGSLPGCCATLPFAGLQDWRWGSQFYQIDSHKRCMAVCIWSNFAFDPTHVIGNGIKDDRYKDRQINVMSSKWSKMYFACW